MKDNIISLEKDNKFLMQQAKALRFEMVELDKRRIQLEMLVEPVKK